MSLIEIAERRRANPLEVIEHMAATNDWSFERPNDDEIAILVRGKWTDYRISFTWMADIEALHLACAFECKVPDHCRAEVLKLLSMINERMWVGHFDLWFEDGLVMYRHALVLTGGLAASAGQCESLLSTALDGCECYYPAFQFVVWAGKTARDALDAATFETSGHA
ncbi:MAG TPA: YbjN domain-containing protein [Xanthobacteraceae bacterium]|jgi:hypothetical protein